MAEALRATGGNVSEAARTLGVSRSCVHERIAGDPGLQQIVQETRETALDIAESALLQAVRDGHGWAVCFLLKTRGRSRGYTEKADVSQTVHLVDARVEDMSDKELMAIATKTRCS